MSELFYLAESLWQAPMGWLSVSLLVGLALTFFDPQIPSAYRQQVRTVRWILFPYCALLTGGISPRLMGITGIHWFASFEVGLVLIGGVLLLIVGIRSITTLTQPTFQAKQPPSPVMAPHRVRSSQGKGVSVSFLTLGAEEFHLAFLRGAIWEIAYPLVGGTGQAGYWAAWIALCLALPETLSYQSTVHQRLSKCALLVTTTVLFIFTRNFWLSWLLHGLGWALLMPALADPPEARLEPR
ncbi:MAG: hypothetical protein KF832_24455 [Caldilineaceae bacterium]|nr:hypothetical protein [Caldilineaceae bacterium]